MLQATSDPIDNVNFLTDLFTTESNISAFFCRSSLFQHARLPTDTLAHTHALRQLSAKLHIYYGLDVEPPCSLVSSEDGVSQVHPYARSQVYDLRRYKASNLWGPFLDDGSCAVDWEKLQAIMIDLCYNIRMYSERGGTGLRRRRTTTTPAGAKAPWETAFSGLAPGSYRSQSLDGPLVPPLNPDLDALDPYGVTGTWMRVVCFLNYSDLYSFNFEGPQPPDGEDREPIDTREAFRLIRLQLNVTSVDDPGEDDHPDWPVVSFEGRSKSTHIRYDPNANSSIRGTVRTTPSGAVRWTTFSIFQGEERWRSEGVQIGGLRSARGILGNWFDKDYDAAGPAGPTAFWKVSDDMLDDRKQHQPPFYVTAVAAGGVGGLPGGLQFHEVVQVLEEWNGILTD